MIKIKRILIRRVFRESQEVVIMSRSDLLLIAQ